MERLFGLEPGTFDGTFESWVAQLHPDDAAQVLATADDAVAGATSYAIEHRVIWPDGTERWLQGRGTVTVDEDGAVTGTIGCASDITDRKRRELETRERAEQATWMAEAERVGRERLEFLAGMTESLVTAVDHRDYVTKVTAAAVPRLGDWCSLHFRPDPGQVPEVTIAHSDPSKVEWALALEERYPFDPDARWGVAEVLRTGRPQWIFDVNDRLKEQAVALSPLGREVASSIIDALDLTSIVIVPLLSTQGVIGAMQFVSAESGRHYDRSDLALAQAVAGRVAEGVASLWQSDQQRRIAATLQRALLPPGIPVIEGVSSAVRYWPSGAAEAGGDFYDLFEMSGRRWAVVIGDVCGKGSDAAAVTGIARHTIRAAALHGQDHRAVLEWVNQAVMSSARDQFCTAVYATLEDAPDGWTLSASVGGHPLPVIVRGDGSVDALGAHGTLLGVFPDVTLRARTVSLHVGDTVVFFTDGVTDVPPPHTMTDEAFTELLVRATADGADAETVADRIESALAELGPLSDRVDDIAVVVLHVDG
jgi:PAS domain S-box-containing protein